MEESDKLVICEIFSDVQSGGTQKANIKRLSTILNNKDRTIRESSLNYVLRGCLDSVFIFPKGNSHIDRLLKFLCSLFSALKQESQVVFLQHVATRTGSVNKTVRQRACTFISSILVTLEEELPGDILEEVATALVQRLQDKIPAVRVAAVKAAARLQDPDNMEDQIIQELLRIMNSDSSVTVRTAAVDSILLTSATVTHIIERIRDISIDVRISAINRLEKETDPRKLNVQMRSSIIRYGLTDREEKVNAATRKLIVNWLRLINNNVTMMLRSIDPNENEEVAFLLGMNIMEEILHSSDCPVELRQAARDPYNSWDTCTIASLPPCEILWINIRCMYATKMCAAVVSADIIGSITPDAIVICRLLAGVLECENLKDDSKVIYNVKQLLKLVAFVDQADVCGINKLSTLLSTMVSNLQVPESLVEQIMVAVTNISCGTRSHVEYLETFLTLAEDIRKQADNPEENDEIQIDLIERSLQVIFFTLQTYSNGMRDTGDSIECLKKVLPLILSSLQQPVFSVRGLAIGSLGIICAVSEKLCDQYASVLQQVSQVEFEDPENRVRAIQALTDIACVWPEKFRNSKDVCNLISRCFESPEEIIKCYALESAMKLLFAGICDEPKFLATLVKNFFISDTEEDINTSYLQECGYPGGRSRLQQLMSVFFQTFFSSTNYASITTVLESIPQLVADTTADIKCEMSDVSLMKKV